MRLRVVALTVLICGSLFSYGHAGSPNASWLFGVWVGHDRFGRHEIVKFLPNGTMIRYGPNCEEKSDR